MVIFTNCKLPWLGNILKNPEPTSSGSSTIEKVNFLVGEQQGWWVEAGKIFYLGFFFCFFFFFDTGKAQGGDVVPTLGSPAMKVNIQGQRQEDLTHICKKINLSIISAHLLRVSFYVPAPLRRISVRIKSYSPTAYVRGVVKNTDAELIDCVALGSWLSW